MICICTCAAPKPRAHEVRMRLSHPSHALGRHPKPGLRVTLAVLGWVTVSYILSLFDAISMRPRHCLISYPSQAWMPLLPPLLLPPPPPPLLNLSSADRQP